MSIAHLLIWWSALISITSAKTCRSMDIRNKVDNLRLLQNCTVIEGFLQVVLIDKANEDNFANYTFPLLREVTEFVIFFRVNGLRSIASLFPNLSVIRGEQLATDYALIVHDLPNLQEINLPTLVIIRGAVAIGKNPRFCFANTIDWDQVAPNSLSHLIFSNGGDVQGCPKCAQCSNARCWNGTTCQVQHVWMSPEGKLCDEQCLGGCIGEGPSNCTACKHVTLQGTCITSCPYGTLLYKERYCISYEECKNELFHRNITRVQHGQNNTGNPWFPFNQSCIMKCPHGYERDSSRGCIPCIGICKKVCAAVAVDSLSAAQSLRDCTVINNSLYIHLSSGKSSVVAKELENSLGQIEEIIGVLTIAHSYPLQSLNFLRNLKLIHGDSRAPLNRSFIVFDNPNLKELWDWDVRPSSSSFKILNGRPYFHHNPKLCLNQIQTMLDMAGVKNISGFEVAPSSNGYKYACYSYNITVSVPLKFSNSAILLIHRAMEMEKEEVGTRYIVYYKKVTNNITLPYEGDDCSDSGWNVNDVLTTTADNMNGSVYHSINRLEPDTEYAYFVTTYTVRSKGAKSPLQQFRTLPSQPGMPTKVMAHSNSSKVIVLKWDPPLKPNGKITKYLITGELLSDYPYLLQNRNYCEEPVRNHTVKSAATRPPTFKTFMKPRESCCDLEEKRMNQSVLMCEAQDKSLPKIPLKDPNDCDQYLYDLVANTSIAVFNTTKMFKRSIIDDEAFALNGSDVYVDNAVVRFSRVTDADNREISILNVRHYSEYVITVTACREPYPDEQEVKNCSQKVIEFVFTQPDPTADNVESLKVVTFNRTARLTWDKPRANGLTVSYYIEILRTDLASASPNVKCVPSSEADGTYDLQGLELGNYRVRIRSISVSEVAMGKYSAPVTFTISEYSLRSFLIVIVVVLVISIVIGAGIGAVYYYKYKHLTNPVLIPSVNPEYIGLAFNDSWELPRERIKIIKELRRGNFGVVCEGVLSPENQTVAVKRVIDHASSVDVMTFMNEAQVMQRFTTCHHIVRLIGVVSKTFPQLIVMEMMAKGDLRTFLRESRDSTPPSPAQMCLMAAQIADGMAYLEAERFVHRDMAARNCMVAADNTVKIGDFGMARDIISSDYYRKGNRGLLPIRWMAPESLNDGVFSSKSDVWSYGIVLWEIVTLASQPYQGMSNEQVIQYVVSGNKLELPAVYPKRFKPLMFWCWKWKPKFRPTFIQILMEFEDYMTLHFRHTSYYYSPDGAQAREMCLTAEQEEVDISETNDEAHFSRSNGHTSPS